MLQLANLSSARTAIHLAYSVQLHSKPLEPLTIHGTKDVSNSLIASAIEAGKVIAVVESLPRHLRHWAVWAYGPESERFSLAAQGGLFEWLVKYLDQLIAGSERKYRTATVAKIRDVVAYAVLNYRSRSLCGRDIHQIKEIKKGCGIQNGHWARDFLLWYNWALVLCEWLDVKTLPPVGKLLALVRDEQEDNEVQKGRAEYVVKPSLGYLQNLRNPHNS